jgi:hypothetical protein
VYEGTRKSIQGNNGKTASLTPKKKHDAIQENRRNLLLWKSFNLSSQENTKENSFHVSFIVSRTHRETFIHYDFPTEQARVSFPMKTPSLSSFVSSRKREDTTFVHKV